jgi:hypothetical protein
VVSAKLVEGIFDHIFFRGPPDSNSLANGMKDTTAKMEILKHLSFTLFNRIDQPVDSEVNVYKTPLFVV